ncbi:ABC transporter ATP-binding protein [Kineosporia succinea]|uniref:Peptide/nickel transport system ATP-binding protein n=1 Tax=Kineosporia succinea TaxID=84632 RepID=A0ABT9P878_9ACTN|nr:ABC transporter ATP-binding protein [Kineosporia succinea]MDP9828910.1 peptide/nickel transport system ATP-binding protein [Kineosporia succinea]
MSLLSAQGLTVSFGTTDVVAGIDFEVPAGGTLGIVGESGSGKSMTSLAIMGLLPASARRSGRIDFDGTDLTSLPERQMRAVRGNRIAMVFQDPLSSLNPYYTVGTQIAEAYRSHRSGVSRKAARQAAIEAMERVHIKDAGRRVDDYPHQFSGGMRQRVMIAMALSTEPELIIADEPTTALDVTVQAQILDLLAEVRRDTGAALILITHDLAVVSEVADQLIVMRDGSVVERGSAERIFSDPQHAYTQALLDAVPRIDDSIGELRTTTGGPA